MRPLREAQLDVLEACPALATERVPLQQALGLVLGETVVAPHAVPPFANSAMDGYAVRAEDTLEPPSTLPVLEDVPAGHVASSDVEPGTAIKIMTGAPMPGGANAVVKVEDTEPGESSVRILVRVDAGEAVRPAGGDLREGDAVLEPGVRLGPAHLAVLASIGHASPVVSGRPRVAILSTGDEVLSPEVSVLRPGQIRDTNRPLLAALLGEFGADVVDLGIIPDDEETLRRGLSEGASRADAVLTSGGVSMGEYDLVKAVLSELGDVEFWKVAMQPAKPFAFGLLSGTPLFGLPGNPVSVMVAFEQFARPALLSMMRADRIFRPRISGVMTETVRTDPRKTVFVRVEAHHFEGRWEARLSGGQHSNVLSALAAANAFAVVPVGKEDVEAGAEVELEMFQWPETRTRKEVLGE